MQVRRKILVVEAVVLVGGILLFSALSYLFLAAAAWNTAASTLMQLEAAAAGLSLEAQILYNSRRVSARDLTLDVFSSPFQKSMEKFGVSLEEKLLSKRGRMSWDSPLLGHQLKIVAPDRLASSLKYQWEGVLFTRFAEKLGQLTTISFDKMVALQKEGSLGDASKHLARSPENDELHVLLHGIDTELELFRSRLKGVRTTLADIQINLENLRPPLLRIYLPTSTAKKLRLFGQSAQIVSTEGLTRTLVFASILLLPGLLISLLFSFSVASRVKRIGVNMRSIAQGDLVLSYRVKGHDEFKSLSDLLAKFTQFLRRKIDQILHLGRQMNALLEEGIDLTRAEKTILESFMSVSEISLSPSTSRGAALLLPDAQGRMRVSQLLGNPVPPYPIPAGYTTSAEAIRHYFRENPVQVVGTVFESCINSKNSLHIRDYSLRADAPSPDSPLFLSSLIVIYMSNGENFVGLLLLTESQRGVFFSDLDYVNSISHGEFSGIFLDNLNKYQDLLSQTQTKREFEIIREVQNSLLPSEVGRFPGVDVGFFLQPYSGPSEEVFFDFTLCGDGKFLFFMCGITGIRSSVPLMVVVVKTIFHLVAKKVSEPAGVLKGGKPAADMLNTLNAHLTGRIPKGHYVSMEMVFVDTKNGVVNISGTRGRFVFILSQKSKKLLKITLPHPPLGEDEAAAYDQRALPLSKGDAIILLSKELQQEDRDEASYTPKNILSLILKNQQMSAKETVDTTKEYLEGLSEYVPAGDLAMLLFKFQG